MKNIHDRIIELYEQHDRTLSQEEHNIITSWEEQKLNPDNCVQCIKTGLELGWTLPECDQALRAESQLEEAGEDAANSNDNDNGLNGEAIKLSIDDGRPIKAKGNDPKFIMTTTGLHHGDDWLSGPFKILGRARDPNGSGWARYLEWEDPDGNKHAYPVPDAKLHADASVLCADLAQHGLKIATAANKRALFISYLNHIEVPKRVTTVTRTGWHELSNCKVFVLPGRTIGDNGDEMVVFVGAQRVPYAARGSLEDWKNTVGKLVAAHDRTVFAVSASLASTLTALIDAEGGGFNLYGLSSSGKTTAVQAAASVWGRGDEHGFIKTWSATANGLEGAAVLHNDLPLVLDELGVAEAREVSKVAYTLSGGTGKNRATRDGTLKESHKWRATVLSTGELRVVDKIAEGGRRARAGQEVRVIDIPADAGKGFGIFDSQPEHGAQRLADEIKTAAINYYGLAGPLFVECLLKEGPERVSETLRGIIAQFQTNKVHELADGQVKRACKRFALVAAAGEMAILFGIVPWEEGSARLATERLFDVWIEGRGGTEPAEIRNTISHVRGILERFGNSRFDPAEVDSNLIGHPVHDRLGWVRGQGREREWLIPPEIWRTMFADGFNPTRVAEVLCARNMLRRWSDGFASSVTIDGKKRRVYVLTAKVLGGDEADE